MHLARCHDASSCIAYGRTHDFWHLYSTWHCLHIISASAESLTIASLCGGFSLCWGAPTRAESPCRIMSDQKDLVVDPPITVLEEGAGDDGPSRLECSGCSLEKQWAEQVDDSGQVVGGCVLCSVTLCGEAGTLIIFVPEQQLADGAGTLPALRQPVQVLPGVQQCLIVDSA